MWLTKIIVKKTWLILTITIVFALLVSVLAFIFGGFKITEDNNRDYLVWSSQLVKDWDMLELAKEAVQTNYADGIQPLRTTVMYSWVTSVTFECST